MKMGSVIENGQFTAHRCDANCTEMLVNLSDQMQCNMVCYRGCDSSCLKDYDPLFQFEVGLEGVLFGIGNTISLVCLTATFLTFCVFKPLRTVSGLAVMNLCVALFWAKFSFLVNPHFTDVSDHWCSTLALLQHYFCLAAFHWVSVLANDLLLTVKKGRRQEEGDPIKKDRKSSHPRFLTYALFAWGLPWAAVLACATVEALEAFDYHYGNHEHCGVFGDEALLYSLAIPLTLITTVNIGIFILVALHPGLGRPVSVQRAQRGYSLSNNRILQQIKHTSSRRPFTLEEEEESHENSSSKGKGKRDNYCHHYGKTRNVEEIRLLNIYVSKSFLMVTAWLSGFLAGFTHVYGLWIVFILMNALQGVFMFKSFVLQEKVKKMWRNILNNLLKGKKEGGSRDRRKDTKDGRRQINECKELPIVSVGDKMMTCSTNTSGPVFSKVSSA